MKKVFKWPGGKSRELKRITALLPESLDKIIEPFAGSAAVAFKFEKPSVLNDLDKDIVNIYKVLKSKKMFTEFREKIDFAKTIPYMHRDSEGYGEIHSLEAEYYKQRDIINEGNFNNPVDMAYAFYITRQLCFSGMLRQNGKTGKSNVPYGWYRKFADNPQIEHHEFLKKCTITSEDYSKTIKENDKEGNFIFVDPPYRERCGYPSEEWNDTHHNELARILKEVNHAKWLLIHCEDELYRELYKDYSIVDKDFKYSVIKVNNTPMKHLYIKNY